jgi:hypothetical protein
MKNNCFDGCGVASVEVLRPKGLEWGAQHPSWRVVLDVVSAKFRLNSAGRFGRPAESIRQRIWSLAEFEGIRQALPNQKCIWQGLPNQQGDLADRAKFS